MRGRAWLSIAFAVGVSLLVPAVSGAQLPTQDSVTGSGMVSTCGVQPGLLEIDAHSGPSGENPTGHTLCTPLPGPPGANVTCLVVQGNVALLSATRPDNGVVVTFRITDKGATGTDVVEGNFGLGCPNPAGFTFFNLGLTSGDYVVVDAPPQPTALGQCMETRWVSYGIFKTQGDCVSFVATGGKNPPAAP
jgi:hypothetical protein